MGNATITPQKTEAAEFWISPENGMLAFVPGDLISDAIQSLPRAQFGVQSPRVAQVDVPGRGLVNITLEVASYKKGKSLHWFWRLVRADLVAQGQPAP